MATGRLLKRDFDLFVKEAKKWVEILGLKDWEFQFIFGDCDRDNRAEYMTHISGRMVTIYLNEQWQKDDKSPENIRRTAFHEVAEIMVQDLRNMALRDSSVHCVDEATHKIIRTLENVLLPKY